MKKFLKLMCVLSMLTLTTHIIRAEEVTTPENPVDVEPTVIVSCSGNSNRISKISGGHSEIKKRTGIFYVPGSTATVTRTHTVTVSNQTNLTLFPEFLSLGYSYSYAAGNTVGWQATNSSSSTKELVVKAFYDRYRVDAYRESSPGSGSCTITTSYRNLYRGWGYDFN